MQERSNAINATSRRERRKAMTRRRLIEAADALFREQGFEATTVEAIAAAADVAKGTFFNYFRNKQGVLVAILHARIEEAVQRYPPPTMPTEQRIYAMLDGVRASLRPYCRMLPHLLVHTMLPRRFKPRSERRKRPLMVAVVRILEEGQASGEVRPDVSVVDGAELIVTHFFRLAFENCLLPNDDAPKARLEAGMEIIFHGLLGSERVEAQE